MFCTKCGNEITEGSEFCSKCGTKVSSSNEGAIKPTQTAALVNAKQVNPASFINKASALIKTNKYAKYVIAGIAVLVIGLLVLAVVNNAINAKKEKAYNEGIELLNSGSLPDAEDQFINCQDYKDGGIYYACTKAARQIYNDGNPGDALTTLHEMIEVDGVKDTITKYSDRESSKLACFIAGEVYYGTGNYSTADSYYSCVPITYEFNGHGVYARRALIALVGTWTVQVEHHISDTRGSTHIGYATFTIDVSNNGEVAYSGYGRTHTTDGE